MPNALFRLLDGDEAVDISRAYDGFEFVIDTAGKITRGDGDSSSRPVDDTTRRKVDTSSKRIADPGGDTTLRVRGRIYVKDTLPPR